jgi:ankyrin repeat protein
MKYIKLFENFESHDPYELMIIPPNKKAEMIAEEIYKDLPNLNLVSDLIVLGANVDWQDEDNRGMTLLHNAAWEGSVEIVRMLIDAKADLNVQDEEDAKCTPLHYAAFNGHEKIVRMLINAGANLNVQNGSDSTPLHDAAENEQVKVIKILIDAGARKDIKDEWGQIPYDIVETSKLKNLLKP